MLPFANNLLQTFVVCVCKHVRGGEWGKGGCLWELKAHSFEESSGGFDVSPVSPLRKQSNGGKWSSKIGGKTTMQEEEKHCHSVGHSPHQHFHHIYWKNRQESERGSTMWLIFLPFPFLHCKFLNRPKRMNCFFKFYQWEGSPAELQFSAQRLLSCLARSFQANI